MMSKLTVQERTGAMMISALVGLSGLLMAAAGHNDAMGAHGWIVMAFAAVMFFIVAAKVKFAVATTIITGLLCGFAMFLALGGGEWVMTLIQGETVNALGTTVHQIAAPDVLVLDESITATGDAVYRLSA